MSIVPFWSFCLCSAAPLPCSFCVCLLLAWRVLCFFNLIPICEPHLHINPIGEVGRGPLFFCEILQPAAQCDQLALTQFVRIFVVVTVPPTAKNVHFSDLTLWSAARVRHGVRDACADTGAPVVRGARTARRPRYGGLPADRKVPEVF